MFDLIVSNKYRHTSQQTIKSGWLYAPTVWSEHCMECAAPLCYGNCPRFKMRKDGVCVRIENGISATDNGVNVSYRSWAKIETPYNPLVIDANQYKHLTRFVYLLDGVLRVMFNLAPTLKIRKFFSNVDYSFRQKLVDRYSRKGTLPSRLKLYMNVTSNEDVRMGVDIKENVNVVWKGAFELKKGQQKIEIELPILDITSTPLYLNLHPINSEMEVCLTFNTLEIVGENAVASAKKVKCCIWDLDNTLWQGILIENDQLQLRNSFIDFIKETDVKGIVHSICSKNDFNDAMAKLKDFGIDEYFVFPKINWNPKSQNIQRIVKQMNINADTIIFIDDNPFERSEVSSVIKGITCIDPSEILELSKGDRFNVEVSSESKDRRNSYKLMEQMQSEQEEWEGDINDFLKSCELKGVISKPNESNIERCYELLQRSNQLNASGRRLSFEELQVMVESSDNASFVLNASDKFGDYGIVGFLSINTKGEIPVVTDFVISCRVANRMLEPTVLNYLTGAFGNKLRINYKKTDRNGPMFKVIQDLGSNKIDTEENEYEVFEHVYDKNFPQIVNVEYYSKQ